MVDKEPRNPVPERMTPESLVAALLGILSPTPNRPGVGQKVAELVNQPGAAEMLLGVLQSGDVYEVEAAAIGLAFARSQLVRRRLWLLAKQLKGDRRLACIGAFTTEELDKFVAEQGENARKTVIESSSLLALNRPADFVALVCDGSPSVGASAVDEIETMRQQFGIGTMALYGPLLKRPLSREAVLRVADHLRGVRHPQLHQLLDMALSRLRDEEQRRILRREQLRHASRLAAEGLPPERDGYAVLRPLQGNGQAWLEIYEELASGQGVHVSVFWPVRGPLDCLVAPVDHEIGPEEAADPKRDALMTLGQAFAFLTSFPESRREALEAVIDRYATLGREQLLSPVPGTGLTAEQSLALLERPMWRDWRPFEGLSPDGTGSAEQLLLAQYERRGGAAWLAEGLQHMALVMSLRGEPEAAAVEAEAVWAARKRPSPFQLALAARARRAD